MSSVYRLVNTSKVAQSFVVYSTSARHLLLAGQSFTLYNPSIRELIHYNSVGNGCVLVKEDTDFKVHVEVVNTEDVVESCIEDFPFSRDILEGMLKKDLVEAAKSYGLDLTGRETKAVVIDKILEFHGRE